MTGFNTGTPMYQPAVTGSPWRERRDEREEEIPRKVCDLDTKPYRMFELTFDSCS